MKTRTRPSWSICPIASGTVDPAGSSFNLPVLRSEKGIKRGIWDARVETETRLTADRTHFQLSGTVRSIDRGKPLMERIFKQSFKRECL